jgi:uncharacterized protein with ParB-like and HNH nuclease domain
LNANETKLQKIVEGTVQYVVPLFQRAYSWRKEQWKVLWEDIVELVENPDIKSHFIGSIVTMPTVSVPEGVGKYLLIDGQQRLTTIFVLMAVIRDLASFNEDRLSQEINETYLINKFKEDTDRYKLLPTQSDRSHFSKLIDSERGEINEISDLYSCYLFFEREIRRSSIDLRILTNTIISKFSVVSIVLGAEDNAHLVFESLNAKGRPLTQADLIRNFFFMRLHSKEHDTLYETYWMPMQRDLRDDLTEFIRHYIMKSGLDVRSDNVYFSLKDQISMNNAMDILKDLANHATYYKRFIDPNFEPDPQISKRLFYIKRLDMTTTYPFLLNCYHHYALDEIRKDEFIEILDVVENFVLRRIICGIPSNDLRKIFPSLFQQAVNSKDRLVNAVKSILQTKRYPTDNQFRAELQRAELYGRQDREKRCRHILERLESSFGHKEGVPFDLLTIEHVMPQTLSDEWKKHLGATWQTDFDLMLNTLGNLTLTGYNSELSNSLFSKKKELLSQSHLELNRYFQDIEIWNADAIEKRSSILADQVLTIWPYFGEAAETGILVDAKAIVTGTVPVNIFFLKQLLPVSSWREVLTVTLKEIASIDTEKFLQMASHLSQLISTDGSSFRRPMSIAQISGIEYFVETHLSAQQIYRTCKKAIELIDLEDDDWVIEY